MEETIDMKSYQEKKCTWTLEKDGKVDPHSHTYVKPRPRIYNNAVEMISNSPMVRLNKIPISEGIKCEICLLKLNLVAKCEFYLPGGSLKDRIGKRMIEDAEKRNEISPGKTTIIEATSGNTGIGLALCGAVKGYDVIITLPEKMSQEKSDVLSGLGATIVRTPTEANFWDADSHMGVAKKLRNQIKDSVILDQYINAGNSMVHFDETAEEIWDQCEGKLDVVVITAGTGGTITGIGRKLKEKNKNIQIIGVDPNGSILALPEELNKEGIHGYKVEGVGYDFIPKNCDRTIADKWYKNNDMEAFTYSRRLIREEGLLVGGSAGACLWAALQYCKDLSADKRVVCIFTDSVRNYMTKFLNDDWMLENQFLSQEDYDSKNRNKYGSNKIYGENNLISELGLKHLPEVKTNQTVSQVITTLKNNNTEYLPVVNEEKVLIGIISTRQLTVFLTSFKLNIDSPIQKAVIKDFKILKATASLKYLSKAFSRHNFVVISNGNTYSVATSQDVLDHFTKNNK